MHADREFLLFDLMGLYIGLEVDSALIVVVPVDLVELQIDPTVVDLPVILEPTRLPQLLLEVPEDGFYIFHAGRALHPMAASAIHRT